MANGLGKPPAGAFGARVLSRFLDGLTARYQRGEAQTREDELLAGKREEARSLIGERREYETGVREEERGYQERLRGERISREDELIAEKAAQAEEAATVAHGRRLELQELVNAVRGINQPPKPPRPRTDPEQMRDLRTMFKDELTDPDMRSVIRKKKEFGYDTTQAVGAVKGEYLAKDVLEDMQNSFVQWGKKQTDKFIRGDDLLMALSANGLLGEIKGLDPNGMYSAKEAIVLLTSAQENPIFFAHDYDSMKSVIEIIHDLLEQSYDPGAEVAPKEQVDAGKAFTKAFGKLTRPSGNIPRLP